MKRKPLGRVSIDPARTNIFIDSCAFDPKYSPEDKASQKIFGIYESGKILLTISHSTLKELQHPNVPNEVKREAQSKIYTINVQLVQEELQLKEKILDVLAGNGKRENMTQDADHIFEAQKYGKFFVTTDKGILKKKVELNQLCGVIVILPSEILSLIESYAQPNNQPDW